MNRSRLSTLLIILYLGMTASETSFGVERLRPLSPVSAPLIIDSSPAFPGGHHEVGNILTESSDGRRVEYASAGKGVETFIEFDFGRAVRIEALEHIDRDDPATIVGSELVFSRQPGGGDPVATIDIRHSGRPAATTFVKFEPVTARYARWRIKALGNQHRTVGGERIRFYSVGEPETGLSRNTMRMIALPYVFASDAGPRQPLRVEIDHRYAEPVDVVIAAAGSEWCKVTLRPGHQTAAQLMVPPVARPTPLEVAIEVDGTVALRESVELQPVRPWEFHILPHSHVDIGYTHVQADVEKRQYEHFLSAMELIRKTADYPAGARFKWNAEVIWAVDCFLKHASADERDAFFATVRNGNIGLDALYGNQLTGLCRPEELFELTHRAREIARENGVTIDTAMISDVPGWTWGLVPALAHSGVRCLSIGPNFNHRIGRTLEVWGDKPFYWVSPSGRDRILCWMDGTGYSWFLYQRGLNEQRFLKRISRLEENNYPYDMVQVRYTIGGDNGPPDPALPEFVKQWNAKYIHPSMVITTTGAMFDRFVERYGDTIAEERGDFTPYWEDGAASTARETAATRTASERLVQAATLRALLKPSPWPAEGFDRAWRNVLLYNEHTWGAHMSISRPDSPFTRDQWETKRRFAVDADAQSRALLKEATSGHAADGTPVTAVDVFNTQSWTRHDVVVLPPDLQRAGDRVTTADNRPIPSQRLSNGALAVRVDDVPPLGALRLRLWPGPAQASGQARADGHRLSHASLSLEIDPISGAIAFLTADGIPGNLVDSSADVALNDYVYVASRNPTDTHRVTASRVTVKESGPLVAELRIESDAPGCHGLTRDVRLIDGLNRVEIVNVLDKIDQRKKESVHLGFGLNVPNAQIRLDIPWAVIRPDEDQLDGACKNYFSVGRWVDVSNTRYGVTCATLDAPLVELGAIRVDVPTPRAPDGWIDRLAGSYANGTFYSYLMNNYWETNYKASQSGPTKFRYALRPHGPYDAAAAKRFGIERSQPLLVVPVDPEQRQIGPRARIEPAQVVLTSLRRSRDGKAWMLRLFNTGEEPAEVNMAWADDPPSRVVLSGLDEQPGACVRGMTTRPTRTEADGEPLVLPPWGIATLRAE